MKKIIFSIIGIVCFTCISSSAFANTCESSCTIVDAPSPLLTEYLENLGEITQKLIEKMSDAESEIQSAAPDQERPVGVERDIKATKNRVMASLNSILSFKEHYGSFDFWITLGITNEVPAPVKRDHRLLTQESEKLTQILEKSAKRGSSSVMIENVCEGISNCSIPDASAGQVLASLINNNNLIIQLFQSSVLEKPALAPNGEEIKLVSSGFISEILSTYNKDTLTNCSLCEDGSLANFREKIQNISFKNDSYKQGVAQWKAAWAMLRGGNPQNNAENERALLSDYLQGQGINTQQADIVLGNLERYNESGLSSSDPLTNSSNYTQANITQEADTFQQTLLEKFDGEEKVPFVVLAQVDSEVQDTQTIEKSIHTLFEDQKPFAFVQDTVSQELQARILRMHFSLVRSINLLDKYKDVATEACEKPGGGGRCSYD